MRSGISYLPLHNGRAPPWLFKRMLSLSKQIVKVILNEYGEEYLLNRISNPFWFQSLGCVLGYDWHSSGLSTVLTAVLKESINSQDYNLKVCGGKGKSSLNTLNEIENFGNNLGLNNEEIVSLQNISKLVAKTDNSLVQDGYTLYHHTMFITADLKWAVVQQGMNVMNGFARRYHWIYDTKYITLEPNRNIDGSIENEVLDMTSNKSIGARNVSLEVVNKNEIDYAINKVEELNYQINILNMPRHHIIGKEDLSQRTLKELKEISNLNLQSYDDLVLLRGVGPKTIRALALISELVYGEEPSWEDPVKFSFAHGGKDGTPYKINRKDYDQTISSMQSIIEKSNIDEEQKEKNLLRKLFNLTNYINVKIID